MDRARLVVVANLREDGGAGVDHRNLTVDVDEYLKGSGDGTLTVQDNAYGSACAAFGPHGEGTQYVLFLAAHQGDFVTSACNGSFAITEPNHDDARSKVEEIRRIVAGLPLATETPRTDELAATGTPAAPEFPTSGAGASDSDGRRAWVLTGIAAVAALGLAGAAALAWRGARRA